MSILGAAGMGASAGMFVREYIFNHSKELYLKRISELNALIVRLQGHLDELNNLREQLPQFWEDDNAREYIRALDVTTDKVVHHMKTAQGVINTLQTVVDSFDQSNTGVKGLIDDALALLNTDD